MSNLCAYQIHRKLIIVGAILAIGVSLIYVDFGRQHEADFVQNVWLGGRLVLDEEDPYDPQAWQAVKYTYLPRQDIFPRYIYPVWVAILAVPLAVLPPLGAFRLWTIINLALIPVALHLTSRLITYRLRFAEQLLLVMMSLAFAPLWHNLLEGQFSLLLVSLILVSLVNMQDGPPWLSGLCLAIAMMKPQVSWLVVAALLWWAFVHQRWYMLSAFAVTSVVLWLGPLSLYPDWLANWLATSQWQGVRLIEVTPSVWGFFHLIAPNSASLLSPTVSALIVCFSALWWIRRARHVAPWKVAPLTMVCLLVSPYGLLYEQTALLFPFWLQWEQSDRLWRWILLAWAVALPLVLLLLLALNPPWNLAFAIAQPLGLLLIYARVPIKRCLGHAISAITSRH